MKSKKVLTAVKKKIYKKPKPSRKYQEKLKLDMSFKEALEKSVNVKKYDIQE